jgi:hypothetical protein
MAHRTIVTSQPEIACDVCARRLLRGEHSEVFLTSGRRCNVCELCAPRAMHEGWKREVEYDPVSHAPLRPRRGRSLLERLRIGSRPGESLAGADEAEGRLPAETSRRSGEPEPYDFLGGTGAEAPEPASTAPVRAPGLAGSPGEHPPGRRAVAERPRTGLSTRLARPAGGPLQRAVEVFNTGEYPRRVAGVARSLGVPEVSIHQADPASERVGIVIAWELCWYRYVVDIGDGGGQALVLAQGTTLDELEPDERQANGAIDDRGALSLLAG